MKALSIRQPWANMICCGYPDFRRIDNGDGSHSLEWTGRIIHKNIENRSYPTNYRGRIYIHAATKWAKGDTVTELMRIGVPPFYALMAHSSDKRLVPHGAIIGEVDIVCCLHETDYGGYPWVVSIPSLYPWFTGPWGWLLANPVAYDEPIPYRGQRGLFDVEL